jgi:hypothetical protein
MSEPQSDVLLGALRHVPEHEAGEQCARCLRPMGPGALVADVEARPDMPMATAEWATIHARCVR